MTDSLDLKGESPLEEVERDDSNNKENQDRSAYQGRGEGDRGGRRDFGRRDYMQSAPQADRGDRPRGGPMEVVVENNIEKAMKILKRKLIKEGLFKELKSRRYYEKPSEKKKRKNKEAVKKARKEEARSKKNSMLFS